MGLDQYAYKRKPGEKLHYWRKHNALHGWMQNEWVNRGGSGEFNCVELRLDLETLDRLEKDIKEQKLPDTRGFFFGGDSRFDEEQQQDDLEFIKKAREAIADGYEVIYDSWW